MTSIPIFLELKAPLPLKMFMAVIVGEKGNHLVFAYDGKGRRGVENHSGRLTEVTVEKRGMG